MTSLPPPVTASTATSLAAATLTCGRPLRQLWRRRKSRGTRSAGWRRTRRIVFTWRWGRRSATGRQLRPLGPKLWRPVSINCRWTRVPTAVFTGAGSHYPWTTGRLEAGSLDRRHCRAMLSANTAALFTPSVFMGGVHGPSTLPVTWASFWTTLFTLKGSTNTNKNKTE